MSRNMNVPIICLKCARSEITKMYKSLSEMYDTTGYLPVCRVCVKELYDNYIKFYEDPVYCMFLLCRKLDYVFYRDVIEKAIEDASSYKSNDILDVYIRKLKTLKTDNKSFDDGETTCDINDKYNSSTIEDLQYKWGHFSIKDYKFLEKSYKKLCKTVKNDNRGMEIFLQQICLKELDLRNIEDRNSKLHIDTLNSLQKLLTSAGLDAKSRVEMNNTDVIHELGCSVSELENLDPIEYLINRKDNKQSLDDPDKLIPYTEDYIYRSCKNLITGSLDFDIQDDLE